MVGKDKTDLAFFRYSVYDSENLFFGDRPPSESESPGGAREGMERTGVRR